MVMPRVRAVLRMELGLKYALSRRTFVVEVGDFGFAAAHDAGKRDRLLCVRDDENGRIQAGVPRRPASSAFRPARRDGR